MVRFENAPWICPVCGEKLNISGNSFVCRNRHCYDVAKSGYVNLLPTSGKGNHGDDKLMVKARTDFLNRGFYEPLAKRLAELVCEFLAGTADSKYGCEGKPDMPGESRASEKSEKSGENRRLVIDAGCGEGYYTGIIADAVRSEQAKMSAYENTCAEKTSVVGLDISKEAVNAAARHTEGVFLAVAGTSAMPLPDSCAEVLLNVFSPLFPEEFGRVLRPGGRLIRVVPGERHLWQLKELVYDEAYENPPPQPEIPGFETIMTERLEYNISLPDSDSIRQLFMMTPYYYKTGEKDQRKLLDADSLTTRVEFEIIVYSRV